MYSSKFCIYSKCIKPFVTIWSPLNISKWAIFVHFATIQLRWLFSIFNSTYYSMLPTGCMSSKLLKLNYSIHQFLYVSAFPLCFHVLSTRVNGATSVCVCVCVAEKRIEIVKFFCNNHTIVPFSPTKRTGMFNSGSDLFIVKSKNVKVW